MYEDREINAIQKIKKGGGKQMRKRKRMRETERGKEKVRETERGREIERETG